MWMTGSLILVVVTCIYKAPGGGGMHIFISANKNFFMIIPWKIKIHIFENCHISKIKFFISPKVVISEKCIPPPAGGFLQEKQKLVILKLELIFQFRFYCFFFRFRLLYLYEHFGQAIGPFFDFFVWNGRKSHFWVSNIAKLC